MQDKFAVVYADDGPNGICGQSCSITNPWSRLHLFDSEEKMRDFCRKVESDRVRKNSRVTHIFHPDEINEH